MNDSQMNGVVDASGNPIQRPPTLRDHLKKATQSGRRAILLVIGAITILGGLITNSGKIIDSIWPEKAEAITVPDLAVKLRNTGDADITLPTRGEYWLWPPGQGVQHYSGAYEFKHADGADVESQIISVPAEGERELLIHITNPSLFPYLATGDYHIDFIMRTNQNGRNMIWSGPIPFTKKAMSGAFLFDVFEDPGTENE